MSQRLVAPPISTAPRGTEKGGGATLLPINSYRLMGGAAKSHMAPYLNTVIIIITIIINVLIVIHLKDFLIYSSLQGIRT